MTTTHTVREWLEQLPEPYRTQALANLGNLSPEERQLVNITSLSEALEGAFIWSETPEGAEYWRAVADWADNVGELPTPINTSNATPSPAKTPFLSSLLDPSEGWTQEGFVWINESHDQIVHNPGDVLMVRVFQGSTYTAPTVLSAMAMVNQYRREQWQ